MTKLEKAVELIANEFKDECLEHDCTIADLFKAYQFDSEDMKEEFLLILNDSFDGEFTDDCEIFDDDGTIKTFRQLSKAVRNYQF